MNKLTLTKAARLYSIAMVAHMDQGGAETEEEAAVVQAAMDAANRKLETMGLTLSDVPTLQHCIALAKQN
jgi:ribosome-associated translation inhibitor RaiA